MKLDELKTALSELPIEDVMKVTNGVLDKIKEKQREEESKKVQEREENMKKIFSNLKPKIKELRSEENLEFELSLPLRFTVTIINQERYGVGNKLQIEPRVASTLVTLVDRESQPKWIKQLINNTRYSLEDWFYDHGTLMPDIRSKAKEISSKTNLLLLEAKKLAKYHNIDVEQVEQEFKDKLLYG